MARSPLGQEVGKALGSKEQSIVGSIEAAKPVLLQSIMAATGMTAKQMDSNTELKLFLNSLGNPTNTHEANMEILDRIEAMFGSGDGELSSTAAGSPKTAINPKTGERLILKDGQWQPMYRVLG